jgi:DNA-directed RNA polymerase specialized sigma24 family protein
MGRLMGRDLRVETHPKPAPEATGDVLNEAFDAALRGDVAALSMLLSLLKTRYGKLIFKRLRHHRRGAHTATLDDIFQQSMVDFIEQINSGSLEELPESERRDVVGYFQGLCDRKLADFKKARVDPVNAARKSALPFDIVQDQRLRSRIGIPGQEKELQVRRTLVQRAIARLDPFDRKVMERYLAGTPYSEISRETRTKISTLESLVTRIKQDLAESIASESRTAMIQLKKRKETARKAPKLPKAEEILAAIGELPVEAQNAIDFVHLKGGSIEALARSLGEQGLQMAQAQLARGYESLSVELGVPFPDSFDLLQT